MPLKARMDDRMVLSFSLPDDLTWDQLSEAARAGRVAMTCCGVPAIPKTLHKSGTRFFAHKVRHDCEWAGESAEHEMLKAIAAQAALDAGWDAETEVSGPDWRADVLAEKDGRRVAIEIQMSPQTEPETQRRTRRYAEAGVEVIWLFRKMPSGLLVSATMPAFEVDPDQPDHARELVSDFLSGNLVWNTAEYAVVPITLVGFDVLCSRCGTVWHKALYYLQKSIRTKATIVKEVGKLDVARRRELAKNAVPNAGALQRNIGCELDACPTCSLRHDEGDLKWDEAVAWPHGQVDGWDLVSTGYGWGRPCFPPEPFSPVGSLGSWQHFLEIKGLFLDDDDIKIWGSSLRQAWEDRIRREARAKQRLQERSDTMRKLSESLTQAQARFLIREVLQVDGPVSVSYHPDSTTVLKPVFVLKFSYNPSISEYLKREFSAQWDPQGRCWLVSCLADWERGEIRQLLEFLRDLKAGCLPDETDRAAVSLFQHADTMG